MPNLRDVGGLRTGSGATVARDRLLRSALPAVTDRAPEGITWPPALVLDLRSAPEIEPVHPLADIAGSVVNVPVLSALRPEKGWAPSLPDLYDRVLDEASHHLVDAVQHVANADGTTLVHCAAGKDRTGIVVALLLRLLDVGTTDILDDYMITERHREAIDARLRRDPLHGPVPASFYETPAEALLRVVRRWDATPGGAEGWFLQSGGDPQSLARWRQSAVDPR